MISEPIFDMMSRDPAQDRRNIEKFLANIPERKCINWDAMPQSLRSGIIWAIGYIKAYNRQAILEKYHTLDIDYYQSPDFVIVKQTYASGMPQYLLTDPEYAKAHPEYPHWGINKSKKWK